MHVLHDYGLPSLSVDALTASRRAPVRTRAAIQALQDYLGTLGRGR